MKNITYLILIISLLPILTHAQNMVVSVQSNHYGIGLSGSTDLAHIEASALMGTDFRLTTKAYLAPFKIQDNAFRGIIINPFVYGGYNRTWWDNVFEYGVGVNFPFKPFDVNVFIDYDDYTPEVSLEVPLK